MPASVHVSAETVTERGAFSMGQPVFGLRISRSHGLTPILEQALSDKKREKKC